MYYTFLLFVPFLSLPVKLLGSFVVAALIVGLITALDYRTWSQPSKKVRARRRGREGKWHRYTEQTAAMFFLLMMMTLGMGLALVLVVDALND